MAALRCTHARSVAVAVADEAAAGVDVAIYFERIFGYVQPMITFVKF